MLTQRQVHVFYMDIISAGVSIALTVAINMRVSFKARIADDDHIHSTSISPGSRAAGRARRSALPLPTSVFQRDNAPCDGEKKRASLSNMEQSE